MSAAARKPKRIVFNVLRASKGWALSRRDGEPLGDGLPEGGGEHLRMRVAYFDRKPAAVSRGSEVGARLKAAGLLAQLVIHGRDGRIQSERTYGSDPKKTKG